MNDASRVFTHAFGMDGETELIGHISIGPVKKMSPALFMEILRACRLTTGHDIATQCMITGRDSMHVTVKGLDVQGYFLELNGHGLEACEEAVEDFILRVAEPGINVTMTGSRHFGDDQSVSSQANYCHDGKVVSSSLIRKLICDDEVRILNSSCAAAPRREPADRAGRRAHLTLVS